METADFFLKKIIKDLQNYQFKTFSIGVSLDDESDKNQKLKKELREKIKSLFEKTTHKITDKKNPEVTIIIKPKDRSVSYQIKSLFVYGRYLKVKPNIPQTRWKKKKFSTSVQEEIGEILLNHTQGKDHTFHGSGREDIDVLTLGNGRPFVIEIKSPKIRDIDLKMIEEEINQKSKFVKVKNLQYCDKNKIREIKTARPKKTYQVEVLLENEVDKEKLKSVCDRLSAITISQKTPIRVLRRRKDMIRQRKIYYVKLLKQSEKNLIFEIEAEAGTYIKELITGDQGRTTPSLADILGQKTAVKSLKVTAIDY